MVNMIHDTLTTCMRSIASPIRSEVKAPVIQFITLRVEQLFIRVLLRSSTRIERFVELPMWLRACDLNCNNPDCWKHLWIGQLLRPHMVIRWTDASLLSCIIILLIPLHAIPFEASISHYSI